MQVQQTAALPSTQTTDAPACCDSTLLEACCAPERKAECCGHSVPESCQCGSRNLAKSRIVR
jgi:hypothetical protein